MVLLASLLSDFSAFAFPNCSQILRGLGSVVICFGLGGCQTGAPSDHASGEGHHSEIQIQGKIDLLSTQPSSPKLIRILETSNPLTTYQSTLVSLKDKDVPTVRQNLQLAISRYPDGFLNRYLDRIYCAESCILEGAKVAGHTVTGDSRSFLISSVESFEPTFHHELGHLVFLKNANFIQKWRALLPPQFEYQASSGLESLRVNAQGQNLASRWDQQNFVSSYATSAIDEDIAEVFAALMAKDVELLQKMKRPESSSLKARVHLMVDHLNRIDPRLNETFFGLSN